MVLETEKQNINISKLYSPHANISQSIENNKLILDVGILLRKGSFTYSESDRDLRRR